MKHTNKKTKRNISKRVKKTIKNKTKQISKEELKENHFTEHKNSNEYIIENLLSLRHTLKVSHWVTNKYEIHKITDKYIKKLDDLIDKYVEIYLGMYSNAYDVETTEAKQSLIDMLSNIKSYVVDTNVIYDLVDLVNNEIKSLELLFYSDKIKPVELLAVRDEIIGELQTMKYLLNLRG